MKENNQEKQRIGKYKNAPIIVQKAVFPAGINYLFYLPD